jgi:acetamidase/formamidase
MPFDFVALKNTARKAVHDVLSFEATYEDAARDVAPTGLRVRVHNKGMVTGDLVDLGYAQVLETVTRIIFWQSELDEKSIALHRGATVTLPAEMGGAVFILDSLEPKHGPGEVIWRAVEQ